MDKFNSKNCRKLLDLAGLNMQNDAYLDLDGRQLQLLLTIERAGSLSAAGRQLDLDQSTISYWLDRMRKRLDDPLFVREGKGMVPTPRMIELLPLARQGLQTFEALAQPSAYLPERDTGTLTLAATLFERESVIHPFLKRVLDLAPKLTVEIIPPGSSLQAVALLEQDQADFVLLPEGMLSGDAIMSRKITSFETMVFFDGGFPLPDQDVDAYCERPHVTVSLGNEPGLEIDRQLAKIKKVRHIAARVRNFESATQLIKETPMIVTLPKTTDISNVTGLKCVPLPQPLQLPTLNHHLYWHKRKQHSNRYGYWRKVIAKAATKSKMLAEG